jgi:Mce-associated membrane protein
VEDQPADSGDLTTGESSDAPESTATDVTTVVTEQSTEASPKRRWFSKRRKTVEPEREAAPAEPAGEAEPIAETEAEPTAETQTKPAARVPVGKASRVKTGEPAEAATGESAEAEAAEPAEEPGDPEPILREVTFVPHRPAGKRLLGAAVAAGVLFVGAAGFAGATLQPYLVERATVDTKIDVARTAASAISTLWTYTPDNMESLPDRSAGFLGGDFAYEYRQYIDAIVAPNKQAQVTNTTQVLGAAVETLTRSEATAIVYTNSVATSPMTKNIPSLRYLSYRLTMERRDAKWLITKMSTVTSLDLTPQL